MYFIVKMGPRRPCDAKVESNVMGHGEIVSLFYCKRVSKDVKSHVIESKRPRTYLKMIK